MPANRSLDLGTGLFVVLGFAALAFLTTQLPGGRLGVASSSDGLNVTAKFDNVGDLKPGAPVAMAGVTIGRVTAVGVDTSDYRAVVSLSIDKAYGKLPDDSWANIETSGLLGAKYVGIEAGGSETFLASNGQIENTQSAMVLEKLVNRLFAAFASRGSDDKASDATEETQ